MKKILFGLLVFTALNGCATIVPISGHDSIQKACRPVAPIDAKNSSNDWVCKQP